MARELEYLDEAVVDAEGAARWYAERSPTAAIRFSSELDAAEAAIIDRPEAWPTVGDGNRHYLAALPVQRGLSPGAIPSDHRGACSRPAPAELLETPEATACLTSQSSRLRRYAVGE